MNLGAKRARVLLCAFFTMLPPASFAADVAYTTAMTAAESAYLTASTAAASASITATTAASSAYLTATTAAAALYLTLVTANNTAAEAVKTLALATALSTYNTDMAIAQNNLTTASTAALVTCQYAVYNASLIALQPLSPAETAAATALGCPAPPFLPGQVLYAFAPKEIYPSKGAQATTKVVPPVRQAWSGNQVERAYARHQSRLDSLGNAVVSLATGSGLFPAFGFKPPAAMGTWQILGMDDDRSVFCSQTSVNSLAQWRKLVTQLSQNGMLPATSDCHPASVFPLPTIEAQTISAYKILDRRNYVSIPLQ